MAEKTTEFYGHAEARAVAPPMDPPSPFPSSPIPAGKCPPHTHPQGIDERRAREIEIQLRSEVPAARWTKTLIQTGQDGGAGVRSPPSGTAEQSNTSSRLPPCHGAAPLHPATTIQGRGPYDDAPRRRTGRERAAIKRACEGVRRGGSLRSRSRTPPLPGAGLELEASQRETEAKEMGHQRLLPGDPVCAGFAPSPREEGPRGSRAAG